MRIERIIWRSTEGNRELLTLERATGRITAPAYELSVPELQELRRAVDDCLREASALPKPPEQTAKPEGRAA